MAGYRFFCLTKNKTNPAYLGAQIGAARLAKSLGCELIGLAPDTPDDIDEQRALLQQAIDSRPDAILISPVDETALNSTLQSAIDNGIPLIFFVTSAAGIKADSFVTADNYALAVEIANYLFRHLAERGDIAMIEGLPQSPTSPPRTRGFRDAANAVPGIEIVASAVGNYQYDVSMREMAAILARHQRINGILAANDFMALGAIAAMEQAGRSAAVVGMNAMPDAIKAIKSGRLLATVSYDALSLVCLAVKAAVRLLDGQAIPEMIEMSAEIVDRSNWEAWDRPYDQRPLPVWDEVVRQ